MFPNEIPSIKSFPYGMKGLDSIRCSLRKVYENCANIIGWKVIQGQTPVMTNQEINSAFTGS